MVLLRVFLVRRRGEENIEEKTKADRRKKFKNKDNEKRTIQENSNNSKFKQHLWFYLFVKK